MPSSKVMDKGLIVIPKEVRERMGLEKGDEVEFLKWGRHFVLVPLSKDPVKALRGILKTRGSMDDFLVEKRLELEEEERDLPPPRPSREAPRKAARVK